MTSSANAVRAGRAWISTGKMERFYPESAPVENPRLDIVVYTSVSHGNKIVSAYSPNHLVEGVFAMFDPKRIQNWTARSLVGMLAVMATLVALPLVWAQYPLQYPSNPQVLKDGTAILVEDYANLPLSTQMGDQAYPPPIDYHGQLGRVNALRSEPANAPLASTRLFVCDMNGNLYILDKATKKFTPYITFPQIFLKYGRERFGSGVSAIVFDPDYAKNGKFYTVHVEDPSIPGSAEPTNAKMPSLKLDGYKTTPAVKPPAGDDENESVLIEWTDTNINNSIFEGTAREILRVAFNSKIHPMGDILFDPLAKPGSANYGNLYISVGDGGSGETPGPTQNTPQTLGALQGKILRITPDLTLRPKDKLSENGHYRIPSIGPDANPFVNVPGARGEVFAYGFRNPHRMDWDAPTNTLLVNDIGLHSWEEVDIVKKGANYGYSAREGNEVLVVPGGGKTGTQASPEASFPQTDLLAVDGLEKPVTPVYPVAVYSHEEGDAIGSGFVYRGKRMPQMTGKYIFTDMTTGRVFYTDLAEMIAAGGERGKQAPIHEVQILYKSPYDSAQKEPVKRRVYDIVADAFAHKDGVIDPDSHLGVLPGASNATGGWRGKNFVTPKADPYYVPYGGGRADVRLSMGGDGEIYLLSKSDGMIRLLSSVVAPPPAASKQVAAR
jgi:Glucose / Sorbosone dehydrogenase